MIQLFIELLQHGLRSRRLLSRDPELFFILMIVVIVIGSIYFEKVPREITHPHEKKSKAKFMMMLSCRPDKLTITLVLMLSLTLIQCRSEPPVSVFDISYKNELGLKSEGYKEGRMYDHINRKPTNEPSGRYSKMIGDTLVQFVVSDGEIIQKWIWLESDKTDTVVLFSWLLNQGYVRTPENPELRTFRFAKPNNTGYSFHFNNKQMHFFADLRTSDHLSKDASVVIDSTETLK